MLVQNRFNICNLSSGHNPSMPVSFCAMKKSEFDGVDYAVVERFKAPIEKFNTNKDLQDWAENQSKKILNKTYKGRHNTISRQRNEIIQNWNNYFSNNLRPSAKLLVLKSITKDLKTNNDKLPPDFKQSAIMAALEQLNIELKSNPKYQFDFNKIYMLELKNTYIEDTDTGEKQTGWITIPSRSHDKENFDSNIAKLKTLSAKRWCTKSINSEYYLRNGDFHIYLEDGKPKIAIRLFGNQIVEIEGELNNQTVPQDYLDEVKTYIEENKFSMVDMVKTELKEADERKIIITRAKKALQKAIQTNNIEEIFDHFNISYETDNNGLLTLNSGYYQPVRGITWKDLGVDENKLLKRIKEINGYCDMTHSDASDLGEVRKINGYLKLAHSKLTDLGKLEHVESIDFGNSKIKSLGNLKSIGSNAIFTNSNVTDLGQLRYIGGNADFSNSKMKSLGKLEIIRGNAIFKNSNITDLGHLYEIEKDANFEKTKIQELTNLTTIGGDAVFANSEIKTLNNLETIGGYADFYNSKIENLCNLRRIGKDAIFAETPLTTLGNLELIGGTLRLNNTNIVDLGRLRKIGNNAIFGNSKIKTLNKLEKIGGDANFSDSEVEDLGALKYIKGNADFSDSPIRSYNRLEYIGGNAVFEEGKVPNNVYISGRITTKRPHSSANRFNDNNKKGYINKLVKWLRY